MPSFGGNPGELGKRRHAPDKDWRERPEAFREEDERKALLREEERSAVERERQVRERESLGEGVTLEGQGPPRRQIENSQAQTVPEGTVLEKEDVMRAVVWSEILGPPRSKRPYRRF